MSFYEISATKLIAAVKARPVLYNKDDPDYHSRKIHKDKIWKAVCKDVCRDWEELTPTQQFQYELVLQRRWKNLRTCFARELALQQREQTAESTLLGYGRKRKKYEYFDAMTFLIDPTNAEFTDLGDDSCEMIVEGTSADPLHSAMKSEMSPETTLEKLTRPELMYVKDSLVCDEIEETLESTAGERTQYERRSRKRSVEERLLDMLVTEKEEGKDEDRQFLLSLVSSFKKMSDKQKMQARIEILNVFQKIQYPDESQ